MTDRNRYETEIPEFYLEALVERDCTPEQTKATAGILHKLEGFDIAKALGGSGLILATQMRLHDYGDLRDGSGKKLNDKKNNELWLMCEAVATLENQLQDD